ERAVAVVAIEHVRLGLRKAAGGEEVEVAVVVDVRDRGGLAFVASCDAGGLGDVGERAVAVVAEQPARGADEQVGPTIVVVVAPCGGASFDRTRPVAQTRAAGPRGGAAIGGGAT